MKRSPSLTLFEVAQFSAAKRRRSLAVGESPRFLGKDDHQAPKGRHSNSTPESSVAPSGLSNRFLAFSVGFRPRLNSAATSWLTKSATSKLTLRLLWRIRLPLAALGRTRYHPALFIEFPSSALPSWQADLLGVSNPSSDPRSLCLAPFFHHGCRPIGRRTATGWRSV